MGATSRETQRVQRFLLVGLALFIVSMVGQFRVPLLPDIGRELSLTTTELGLLTTLFATGRLMTDLPAGILVDRLGVRRVLVFVGSLSVCGSLLFATAHTRWIVMTAALVLGIASAVSNLAGMTYFSSNATDDRRGTAMAGYGVAIRGGGALGPAAAGGIAALAGWRSSMWVSGMISAMLAVALAVAGRWGVRGAAATPGPAGDGPAVRPPPERHTPVPSRNGYSKRQRLLLSFVPFTTLFAQGALPQTLIPIIGVESLGLTTAFVGLALGVGGVVRMVGTFAGGWTADLRGRKTVLIPGLLVQVLAVCLLAIEGHTWAWLLSIVLFSIASIGTSVAAAMLGDQAGPGQVARQLGAFRVMGDVGLLAGPLLLAPLFEVAGQRVAALTVAALFVLCTVAVAAYLPETHSTRKGKHEQPLD